ncbi:MAG: glycine zipper 2TM domain-containing protein [Aphanocapsa lilacina HA4352-LM1]|jgi:hypothetical protein|nr:glycine zipper 2TM domain-containing protein [Aphanocapsa lilacina HA4352-LM1]
MGVSKIRRGGVAVALSMVLLACQGVPLLAASVQQLEQTVSGSGLVGSQFTLKRDKAKLNIQSEQIFPNRDELKLALIQLASLLEGADPAIKTVSLRAYLLGSPTPLEGSIAPGTATQLQRSGDPEMLEKIRLASVAAPAGKKPGKLIAASKPTSEEPGGIPVLGDPIDPPAGKGNLPVLGEPLYPGQAVADPATGGGPSDSERPFRTGVSVLRAGSPIPVLLEREVVVEGESPVPIQAVVLQDILSDDGDLMIPGGSQVRGTVEPTPSGARLTLRELYVNDRQYTIRAVSQVYPSQTTRSGGNQGTGMMIGGVAGGVGGSLLGRSVDRRWGGLWGGLLGGLLGSFLGGSMSQPQTRTTVAIPAGTANPQLLEDLTIGNN